ncbi:EAL domain-containing protein [Bacillus spongiae]|uniref:EAL domain-containing protein n=1 Tax=Bacillus spongiae TaxID=2683610 RepID=A0ABU8HIB3_9BACI
MFFLFLLFVAFIPFFLGLSILVMVKRSMFSKALFLFLLLASFWQIDVSLLYAIHYFSRETIDFLFRLFRIGPIMLTPTLFFIAYIIINEEPSFLQNSKWRYIMNKTNVILFYLWGMIVYIVGWSDQGIFTLTLMEPEEAYRFYFPSYGSLSWFFHFNVLLFMISIMVCFILCFRIPNSSLRSFLFYFLFSTTIGYGLGVLNIFPNTRLLPSTISVMVFALSVFLLCYKMHLKVVGDMNRRLDEQKDFLSTVIDLNPNYIYAKDEEGRYCLVNRSYADLYGMRKEEMIGKTDSDVQVNKVRERERVTVLKDKEDITKRLIPEEELINHEGNVRWLQTSKVPIKRRESTVLLGVSTDITERKKHEDEIIYQANHDVLTGLPNRRLFNEQLTTLLQKASRKHIPAAVMFIDLDRFKYINDTLGHDFGDLLLREVSKRLKRFLTNDRLINSQVYRIGGDEFTLLNSNCTKQEAIRIAELLIQLFEEGFIIEGQEFFITPSIGVSMYPEDGKDAKALMKNADTALYHVKERGKNSYQLFSNEMNQHFYRKMLIEKELRNALERKELCLNYQPLVNVKTNQVTGMEALLRWNNKMLGDVPPAEFIPIAEETGLIIPIGEWVLQTACKQNAQWQCMGYSPMKVSVNISMRQLLDKSFVKKAATVIELSTLDPVYIDFEVTESVAMYEPGVIIKKLVDLKSIGITLSMDDFGTGYSSLSYLKKYPIDTLKIDRSFIRGVTSHEDNKAIVRSIISMAKHLHLNVTAEGVEGKEEYRYLSKVNCDYVQGYAISRPLTAEKFEHSILKKVR